MPQAYHRPFGVVSKCALREKKEEGPRFSGDLPSEIQICFPSFRERYPSSTDGSIVRTSGSTFSRIAPS